MFCPNNFVNNKIVTLCVAAPSLRGPALGPARQAEAFNFGPSVLSNRSVSDLVEELLRHWPGEWRDFTDPIEQQIILNELISSLEVPAP
ncbi:MAG: hypothetical protein KBE16_06575 [Alphaproteobacteria bacterium]|nr:hypothetical protein [Alphaproteobacteria bacterium]